MLTKKQLSRYADVLVWGMSKARSVPFKKHDIVVIRYDMPATALAEVLYEKLLAAGRQVVLRAGQTAVMEETFYRCADAEQLVFLAPGDRELIKNVNGNISLLAPDSLTHLSTIDPMKIGKAAAARKPLRDILDKRESNGDFAWTLCLCPTAELARHAGLSLEDYTRQIVKACFLDKKDPTAHWETIFQKAAAIKKWLNSMEIKVLHIASEHTDLEITPGKKRKWVGISGHNIPSFEIFLSPDWRGSRGVYFADMPSFRNGNPVRDMRVEFKDGKAVKVTARAGQAFARKYLSTDPGAARLGEFSLTDKRFSRIDKFMANTLFDENFGGANGNCHVALGASYADTFAGNPAALTKTMKQQLGFNDSAIHWDIVNTEKKRVTAVLENGEKTTIYENGKFTY
ncbi:aminopeptidase [Desulfosudis oleivorans]|nr:aminopeptidase [Desulfosudis oleivorans]